MAETLFLYFSHLHEKWIYLGIEQPKDLCIQKYIYRLNLVKSAKFQKYFFWCFFIRNILSRVDLIIKVVLEFLSDL